MRVAMTARPSLLIAKAVGSRSEAVNEFMLGKDGKLIGMKARERPPREPAIFSETYMYSCVSKLDDHPLHTDWHAHTQRLTHAHTHARTHSWLVRRGSYNEPSVAMCLKKKTPSFHAHLDWQRANAQRPK